MDQPTKSFSNRGGKNRIRFASSKSRAKRATADVYRTSSNDRLTARSATGAREKRVHDDASSGGIGGGGRAKKRRRRNVGGGKDGMNEVGEDEEEEDVVVQYFGNDKDAEGLGIGRTAVIVSSKKSKQLQLGTTSQDYAMDIEEEGAENEVEDEEEETAAQLITGGTLFLTELEISSQRNGSQLFRSLVRELRPLCKSIAELLHHGERIVDLLYCYLLSPRGMSDGGTSGGSSSSPTPCRLASESWRVYQKHLSADVEANSNGYSVNVATNDVLHLLTVLARELRQEMYPFLNTRMLPRIIDDMLNPPTTTTTTTADRNGNIPPLDVGHVEAAFRTLSYLFKYNADMFIHDTDGRQHQQAGGGGGGDADILRRYYGKTICHRRDVVRRLACESYAPLLRKCSEGGLRRHLTRTVRALATSLSVVEESATARDDGNDEKGEEYSSLVDIMTNSERRARDDAIDGVSSLLFEVSRGAPGRVHSKKGRLVVRTLLDCLLGFGSSKKKKKGEARKEKNEDEARISKAHIVYEVASRFLYKLRGHIVAGRGSSSQQEGEDTAGSAFVDVFYELRQALDQAISSMSKAAAEQSPSTVGELTPIVGCVVGHSIDLMSETIDFQGGRLLGGDASDRVATSLQSLLGKDIYPNAGRKLQDRILHFLCSAWKANPTHPSFALRLGKFFPSIVAVAPTATDDAVVAGGSGGGLDPALFLGEHLLPHLPKGVASRYLIPALLGAAASSQSIDDDDSSLVLLHSIATTKWPRDDHAELSHDVDIDDSAADAFFTVEAAEQCPEISLKVRRLLFDICLKEDTVSVLVDEQQLLARVGFISRCIPFLVCLECSSGDGEGTEEAENTHSEETMNRVFKWYSIVLKQLDTITREEKENEEKSHNFIVQALILESFSKSVMECHQRLSSPKINSLMKKTLAKAKDYANSLLFLHSKSLWVVRGAAAVTKVLSRVDPGSKLNERSNETFELLVPNLAESNHFLRLYTLEILDSYPARPFVNDHADLDLTDDLDEEPSHRPQLAEEDGVRLNDISQTSSLSGLCNVISLLRVLESIPIALPNERKITSQLTRVEVCARTWKLPIIYAEAVACHMLGLLHVKFAPVWPAAVKVIVSLSLAQEGPAWPYIEAALKESMKKPRAEGDIDTNQTSSSTSGHKSPHTKTVGLHHSLCVEWETSRGKKNDLFGSQNKERNAQVTRYVLADELTISEQRLSILENAPHLTVTKTKVIVPIFFEFLSGQYYVFHQDEPDMREIDFPSVAETAWPREELGRKSLQKKLECFLKMFNAVKGPQQLFKHTVLLQLFVSLLANPDPKLSNLAFACVLRFKLPYLMPYVDYVQPMLRREGLREALTKFDLSKDSEIVDAEHRVLLLPIVTRILFGRFSSRGNGAKSSKDSPAARRAAILSFFSGIGNESGELSYFIYMMIRAFIPHDVSMKTTGAQIEMTSLTRLIAASEQITSEELATIPEKRQEGFLNLLSDVITQIGFGAKHFVGTFMNLLLVLCEQSEHALVASRTKPAVKKDTAGDHESIEHNGNSRIGRIRTLSFLRLADMFTKFASSVDFTEYGDRLWKSISSSVIALPNTVINAENPPSSLQLIESIASHHKLIPLMHQSDDAIVAVFKCISGTTRMKVMNTVLRIIDGLLTDGGTLHDTNEQSMGQALILKHIHMLISQFTKRLTNESQIANLDEDIGVGNRSSANKGPKKSPTDGLQLNILCRVS